MPPTAESQSPAGMARLIHGSLLLGQILLACVTYFQVRPTLTEMAPLRGSTVLGLFAVSFAACGAALYLRRRVPVRPSDASADLYWMTAYPPAIRMWMTLEAAGLLALIVHFRSGATVALVAAAIPWSLLLVLNPWLLERR